MRLIKKIAILLFLIISFYCKKNNSETVLKKSNTKVSKTHHSSKEKKEIDLQYEKEDSIHFDSILKKNLKIARQNINQNNFKINLKPFSDYEYGEVRTNLEFGNLFSSKQKHLIIRTHTSSNIYINIFLTKNMEFLPVLKHTEWNLTYVKDTIQDINGDDYKDFLVNWYGSSGCCLKNFYNVYLYQTDNHNFSKSFEFINPTFSPKEKLIRGVCYGHPGDTEIYKYKWNKCSIDTIEYISLEKNSKGNKTGMIIISKKRNINKTDFQILKTNKIPEEYKSIYGYDWFLGKV